MVKLLSLSCIVVIVAVFGRASCGLEEGLLQTAAQPQSSLEDEVLEALINTTNVTLLSFLQFGVKVPTKNESASGVGSLARLDQELLVATNEQRGRICLQDAARCMQEDPEYHPTLDHLTQYLFSAVPPFDLSSTQGISERCRRDSFQYLQDLKEFKLWALKMYDASAKLPSGFLSGNINQFGDFDLCLSAQSETDIRGQYCLASVQVEIPDNPYLAGLHRLIQSHFAFKSNLEDPGHRVPRFSSINWALCMPNSCTAKDVEFGLRKSLTEVFNGTDLEVRFEVNPAMCQHADSKPVPWSTILVSGFFALIILTALMASVYDFYGGEKNELLLAFSLRKNILALLSVERPANDIQAVHGIRFLNAGILLLAHKSMALFFIPYMNRTQMAEIVGQRWTVLGRAASLYTDPFIMFSGMLTAYSLFGKLRRSNKINIWQEYVSRLFRILPPLAALILFCTFVFPWLNSGPQWNLVVTQHADKCKQYWWRNMLFIHNYFGFENMCLTHTHHVGIDTQLFFAAPLAILLAWKLPKRGVFVLVIVAVISTVMRYYVTYTRGLSNYVHFGTSIEQLFKTADNMYTLPAYRTTVYIMGILLGYLLHYSKNVRLNAFQLYVGDTIAFLSFCASFFGPSFMGSIDYVYNPVDAAWYAAFAPILWCTSFAWIIFKTHIGYKSFLGQLFSSKWFLISTRLSYAIYLTQFPAFFYNVGITRAPEQYGFFTKNLNALEVGWIVFLSIALTVLFDSPFQNIRNILLKRKSREVKKTEFEQKIK